jgi:uncharacterized RDD family membrane protein YckC
MSPGYIRMSANFQSDPKTNASESILIDPEAYDASEQEFAASLAISRPKFVVDPEPVERLQSNPDGPAGLNSEAPLLVEATPEPDKAAAGTIPEEGPDPNAWRNEVSARLNRYRSKRRPKEPRYPSLQLKFEPGEPAWSRSATAAATAPEISIKIEPDIRILPAAQPPALVAEAAARVLPFRRSAVAPPRPLDELAEPVYLVPRILEASDIMQAQPALGGILIERAEEATPEKRPGFELPLQPAAMSRRLLAVGTDVLLVVVAVALFAYIFFRVTAIIPPLPQIAVMTLALAALLWPAYQYVLLVYSGATPGLKLARLQLARFNGSGVPRRLRRWRVLATALSGISLGLGYAWCILDEDQLCWHDRITGTYMAPKSST